MTVDATAYRPPTSTNPPGRELDVGRHECLRVGVGTSNVWLYPWGESPGTNYAHVERGDDLDTAHLAPATVDALLEIAPIVEPAALIVSPSWPVVDGPEVTVP